MRRLAVIALMVLLAGCAARQRAPVSERMGPVAPPVAEAPPAPEPEPAEKPVPTHTVKKGDTLASIALQYGLDYRELAAWNNIVNRNRIEIGQVLVLQAPPGMPPFAAPVTTPLAQAGPPIESRPLANTPASKVEPRATKVPFSEKALAQMGVADPGGSAVGATPPPAVDTGAALPPVTVTPPVAPLLPPPVAEPEKSPGPDTEDVDWMWPVKGKTLAPFTDATKGMDIAGKKGAPVLAAANGRVIYADSGLRGYGKLVIIRHNNTWLSAYAHNDKLLVKEQQEVRKGQKIAEMGSSDTDQVKLHFEVRRQGKPVDPVRILPSK
jgi:lipoprotein NlpD